MANFGQNQLSDAAGVPENINRLLLALDTDYLTEEVNRSWFTPDRSDISLASCNVERMYKRADGSFIVSYEFKLRVSGELQTQTVFGVIPARSDPAQHFQNTIIQLRKKRRQQISRGEDDIRIGLLAESGMVLQFSGLDERIDGLKLLRSPNEFDHLHLKFIQGSFGGAVQPELLAHRLHRRAVIRFTSDGCRDANSVVFKFYKNNSIKLDRVTSILRFMRESGFGPSSHIMVPQLLGITPEWSGFAMTNSPGQTIYELPDETLLSGMTLAGEALGKIHRLPLRLDAKFGPQEELNLLAHWVDLTAAIAPALRPLLLKKFTTVSKRLASCMSFTPTLIHRDFHEKQILLDGDSGHLVDFDTICNGDPAIDYGNFLAHLKLAELQERLDAGKCAEAFAGGYKLANERSANHHAAAYEAATYLRLSCIYFFNTRWRHLSPALLDLI